jgi:hypothetical protein
MKNHGIQAHIANDALLISYRGRRVWVEVVCEIDGDSENDFRGFHDCLLRDSQGRYYLRYSRWTKLSPNQEDVYWKKICALGNVLRPNPRESLELRRVRAWRKERTRPRAYIKRISKKTALLWSIHHHWIGGQHIRASLREAIRATLGKER